jgi:hypothetical protein
MSLSIQSLEAEVVALRVEAAQNVHQLAEAHQETADLRQEVQPCTNAAPYPVFAARCAVMSITHRSRLPCLRAY